MKTHSSYLPIIAGTLSLSLLVMGCREPADSGASGAPETGEADTATESAATTPPPVEEAETAGVPSLEAATDNLTAQAAAVYEDLSTKLMASTSSESSDLLREISSDLETRVDAFREAIPEMPNSSEVMGTLGNAVKSLLNNEDIGAVEQLNALVADNLTPEQTGLAKEVYNAGAALVTQRNFSSLEELDSDVAKLSTAVWQGDYTNALQPLQNIWNKGSLSDDQKNLLGAVFDDYVPGWRDNAEVINQGLDALKGFGQ